MNKFAERLRYARQLQGLTQAALAKACGLSQGAIANYEGKSRQSAKEIFRLAEALRVSPIWLSQGMGPMELTVTPSIEATEARVADASRTHAGASWPFPSISPEQYWALPEKERQIIEKAVAAMLVSLPG